MNVELTPAQVGYLREVMAERRNDRARLGFTLTPIGESLYETFAALDDQYRDELEERTCEALEGPYPDPDEVLDGVNRSLGLPPGAGFEDDPGTTSGIADATEGKE